MLSLPKLSIQVGPLLALLLMLSSDKPAQDAKDKIRVGGAAPVLWRDPGDVALRNLRYGPGSAALAPRPPFRFMKEDKSGESPKFEVRDARGVKWIVTYMGQVKKEKSMRGIPVEHARWIGSLLSQLTDDQLRDSFRAANYNPATIEGYVRSLRERINQLTEL